MNSIEKKNHDELISILNELIGVLKMMREEETDYLLIQNENEAKEWLDFLKKHVSKEELKSLEKEIADRFFFKFDVQIGISKIDDKRAELMKKYFLKSSEYLQ